MATNLIFGNTTLTSSAPSAHGYLLNDFIMRAGPRHRVVNATTTSPPGSPTWGSAYIIALGASGAWSDKDNQLAIYYGNTWTYISPYAGLRAYNVALDTGMVHDGSNWTYPNYIKDSGSVGTSTLNLDTKYAGVYFSFSASGVTVTLNISSIAYGRQCFLYAYNPNASLCTIDFTSSEWLSPNFTYSVSASTYIAMSYTLYPGGTLEILTSALNGGIAI